jgi:diacylglycerol kinase (ATP)
VDPLLVITNRGAGTAADAPLEQALEVLRERTSIEVAATADPGELDGVLHRAASRRIVVAGGDGSLHAVVSALHRRHELEDAVIGLLPLGTGNDFARTTGIPLEPAEAARVVLDGEVRRMDLMVDELGGVVVNNAHLGAGAPAGLRAHRWKERLGTIGVGRLNLGKLGYPIGALLAATHPPELRLCIELDGEVVNDLDRPVLMVAIGNGATVGGGTEVTPEARPADGHFDVMISRSVGPLAKFAYVARLRRGEHHRRDDVAYLRGREVTVSGEEFWCSADGEVSGPERRRSWRLQSGAFSMVLP